MLSLIRLSIHKPITMLMILLTFVVFGVYTFRLIPINLMPEVDIPVITVMTVYPGAGPEEIETAVSQKVEDELSLLDGVDAITTFLNDGVSYIVVKFKMGVDVNISAMDIKDKIDGIRSELPEDIWDPVVAKWDMADKPVINLAVTGNFSLEQIRDVADDIKEDLAKIQGVASVALTGGLEREILVELDKTEMEARGLTYKHVYGVIGASNMSFPVGLIEGKQKDVSLRVSAKFRSLQELASLEIPTARGVIQLKDVANITDTFKDEEQRARFNGETSVGLSIKKRSDANIIDVAVNVKKELKKIEKNIPEGYSIQMARDNSVFVRNSVDDVYNNILIGVILTAITLLIFLRKFSVTIIAAVTMPVSIVATITFMYAAGFTLNMMTLMALGIAVGILVTNSIVVLENVIKHMGEGDDPKKSAERGTAEIATAVVASTLTNVAVFLPIAFMQSMIGQFFLEFGLTMVFVTGVSLFISFTLTPMMAAKMLHNKNREEQEEFERVQHSGLMYSMERKYENFLNSVLTVRGAMLSALGVLGLIVLMVMAAQRLGGEFVPKSDEGTFDVAIELPSGTNLTTSNEAVLLIEKRINEIPELKTVYTNVGTTEGTSQGKHLSAISVGLTAKSERERSTEDVVAELRTRMADVPDATITVKAVNSTGGDPNASDLDIEVVGSDMDDILSGVDTIMSILKRQPGVADVQSSWKSGKPELVFRPKRNVLADYGITIGEVAQNIRLYVVGAAASAYRDGNDEYDITVKYAEKDRMKKSDILALPVSTPRGIVPMSALVDVINADGPTMISRKDKQRMVKISNTLLPGYTPGELQKALDTELKKVALAGDTRMLYTGDSEMMAEAAVDFGIAIVMAIILTYVLLTGLLESFLQPLIIMATLPLGLIGVMISLYITGKSISIISLMAIVMLIGIVVNNAILIIDYANHLVRKRDFDLRDAAIKGASSKFRAIIMTNMATIMAMMPLALGLGAGAEMRQPMAIASIGGLLVSTTLTMFIIPLLYWMFARFGMDKK